LASIDRGVLTVPVQRVRGQIPLHARGLIALWIPYHPEVARVNLSRLASVSYDYNERRRWFDLADQEGRSLRLLYPVTGLTEKETALLTVLCNHVRECHLMVDLDTRRVLGISDYLP
jgi:hypothetical protein